MFLSLTADTVDGTLDHITGKPVVDGVLTGIVQDVVKLEAEAVLPVVVHPGGGHFCLLLQLAVVHRYRLRLIVDPERFSQAEIIRDVGNWNVGSTEVCITPVYLYALP